MLKGFAESPVCLNAGWHSKCCYCRWKSAAQEATWSQSIFKGHLKSQNDRSKKSLYSDQTTHSGDCLMWKRKPSQPEQGQRRRTAFIRASRTKRLPAACYDQWVRGKQRNHNSLILCDCCWHEGERWRRKSKVPHLLFVLGPNIVHVNIPSKGQEDQDN